jgi:hypothetical protein
MPFAEIYYGIKISNDELHGLDYDCYKTLTREHWIHAISKTEYIIGIRYYSTTSDTNISLGSMTEPDLEKERLVRALCRHNTHSITFCKYYLVMQEH